MVEKVMTKQEEIRDVLDKWADDQCLFDERVCTYLGNGDYCSSTEDAYKCLMERLDKIGVVLKVEGELPAHLMEGQIAYAKETYKDILRKAGYEAVEPLKKENGG